MKIAILGWGSLVTDPRWLPIVGDWEPDGPHLWLEFSRIARSGDRKDCLALVIDEASDTESATHHVLSQRTGLSSAIADLQQREGISDPEKIGYCEMAAGSFPVNALSHHPKSCVRIRAWAEAKGFDAVIWTGLTRRFEKVLGIPFSPDAAMNYINGLPAPAREKTLTTIRNTPAQTQTPLRRLIMDSSAGRR